MYPIISAEVTAIIRSQTPIHTDNSSAFIGVYRRLLLLIHNLHRQTS
ncbi:hypothetical protein [Anabaena azotica]|uniref:Transposase n=1 Tax=Anabaena azotica FACHB-119 TaxID=947527 RepID=A0ABR8CZ44_9NOST|nr:hypothetical protein [Anabaena azotica]MBD2499342.1 hypothetical protein [Anabaena azotica FACHB-119]